MEFKIITDLSTLPQIIETNAEELKTWLSEKLTHYNALVVTPESIAAAKDDQAALNKLRAALEERRKEVKKQCMAPYEDFERKYKELLALIDEPICKIDTQIKALDEQEQKQKYDRLREYFANCEASMDTGVKIDFDSILNPKWRNKTAKESVLQQEIYDTVCRIIADVEELRSYYSDSPHYTAIMNRYSQGYDKGAALSYAALLTQQEQQRAEQEAKQAAQQAVRAPEPAPATVYQPAPEPAANEPEITGMFRVTGTKKQIIALRDFMRANGIKFEIVKE